MESKVANEPQSVLCGVWEFKKPLYCSRSVSGKRYQITIAGFKGCVVFPSCPQEIGEDSKLIPPEGNPFKKVDWGIAMVMPDGLFAVNRVLVFVLADEKNALAIYRDFVRIDRRLSDLALLRSNAYVPPKNEPMAFLQNGGFYHGLELFRVKDKLLRSVPDYYQESPIRLDFLPRDQYHDDNTIAEMMADACAVEEIAFVYELLLNAFQALGRHDYRSAVLLGGVSLEEAITKKIEAHYSDNGLLDFEHDKGRHKTLGGRFTWLRELGIATPVGDAKRAITDVRNSVTHEGRCPSIEETREYLVSCNSIIREFCPDYLEQS